MALIVQKFGGSSVADAAKVNNVASRVVETARAGNQVVVVVSAQGDTTDDLIETRNGRAFIQRRTDFHGASCHDH